MTATTTATLSLVDGTRIVVPDSLDLMTPYVLMEQGDWFEDEIRFLRRVLQPGEQVIDIGANCGVYALSMARTVGPAGKVWAYEPAARTAALLAKGIAANGFAQVVIEQCAVSSACGTGQLSTTGQSELNALVHGAAPAGDSETVALVTLDASLDAHGWQDIGFVKIDAEGEEAGILEGGKRFFAALSPLVQFEVGIGSKSAATDLVRRFRVLGYRAYRLVPGLDLLVPFGEDETPDEYQLNLLCCKPDRGALLAARGFLLEREVPAGAGGLERYGWRQSLAGFPYAAGLEDAWAKTVAAGRSVDVEAALACYARSRDASLAQGARFAALQAGFFALRDLCAVDPSYLRLASLARVARDFGARAHSLHALQQLCTAVLEHRQFDAGEPFLAPAQRFDAVPPGHHLRDWVLGAALEELEQRGAHSSYFTGANTRGRLELIRDLGFGSAEMDRRLRLLQRRFNLTTENRP